MNSLRSCVSIRSSLASLVDRSNGRPPETRMEEWSGPGRVAVVVLAIGSLMMVRGAADEAGEPGIRGEESSATVIDARGSRTEPAAVDRHAEGSGARGFDEREVRGWTIRVSKALLESDPQLAEEALSVIDIKLGEIVDAVPADRVGFLRSVPIVLEWKNRAFEGAVYHPSAEWLARAGLSTDLAGCVELPAAAGFLRKSREQPTLLLHELAHAYHHQKIGFDERAILDAYAAARKKGLYEKVERKGVHGPPVQAYALRNAKEYFAELTEAYFGTNDYFPFTREELRAYDPAGFDAVRMLWTEDSGKR